MSNATKSRKQFSSKSVDPASNPIAALAAVAASKVPPGNRKLKFEFDPLY